MEHVLALLARLDLNWRPLTWLGSWLIGAAIFTFAAGRSRKRIADNLAAGEIDSVVRASQWIHAICLWGMILGWLMVSVGLVSVINPVLTDFFDEQFAVWLLGIPLVLLLSSGFVYTWIGIVEVRGFNATIHEIHKEVAAGIWRRWQERGARDRTRQ